MFSRIKPILFIAGVCILTAYIINRVSFLRDFVMSDKTWV